MSGPIQDPDIAREEGEALPGVRKTGKLPAQQTVAAEAAKRGRVNVFRKAWNGVVHGAMVAGANYVEVGFDPTEENRKSAQSLQESTGSDRLYRILVAAAPNITEKVQELLKGLIGTTDSKYKDQLSDLVEQKQDLLQNCLNATVLRMFANLANHSKEHYSHPVSLKDILNHVLEETGTDLQLIDQRIREIEKIADEDERALRIQELTAPLVDDILRLALPGGVDDIIVPRVMGDVFFSIKKIVYDTLQKALSEQIVKGTHSLMDPLTDIDQKREDLESIPGGNLFSGFAEAIANKVVDTVPIALADNVDTLLKDHFEDLFTVSNPVEKSRINNWLKEMLQEVASSQEAGIKQIRKFTKFYLESILVHTFQNLAFHAFDEEDEENALSSAAAKIASQLNHFFEENQAELLEAASLPEGNEDEKKIKEQRLAEIMAPLSQDLIQLLGWDNPENFPLPEGMETNLVEILQTEFPKFLGQFYLSFMKPMELSEGAVELVEDLDQGAAVLAKISKSVVAQVNKLLVEKSDQYAQDLIDAINPEIERHELTDPDTSDLSQLIQNLLQNEELSRSSTFILHSAEQILLKIFSKLAGEYREETGTKAKEGLIPGAFMQLLHSTRENLVDLDPGIKQKILDASSDIEEEELQKEFIPIAVNLLQHCGFPDPKSLPVPNVLQKVLYDVLTKNALPKLLFTMYKQDTIAIAETEKLEEEFNPEEVTLLTKANHALSEDLFHHLEDHPGTLSTTLINQLIDAFPGADFTADEVKWLRNEMKIFLGSGNEDLHAIFQFTEVRFETMIEHLILNSLHKIASESEEPKQLIGRLLSKVIGITGRSIILLHHDVVAASKIEDPEQRQKRLRELFQPLAKELYSLFGEDPMMGFPLLPKMKENLTEAVQSKYLPDILARYYLETIEAATEVEEQPIPAGYRGAENITAASKLIEKWVEDFIPPFLYRERESVSKLIHNSILDLLKKNPDFKASNLIQYLEFNEDDIKGMLAENIQQLTDLDNPDFHTVIPGISKLLTPTLNQAFDHVLEQFDRIENPRHRLSHNPDFTTQLGIKMIRVAADHFETVVSTTKKAGKKQSHQVSPEDMKAGFREKGVLHSALELSGDEKADEQKLEKFYRPLTEQLLKLAGLDNPDALPLPQELREPVLKLLKSDLGPLIIEEIIKQLLDPHTMNQILLTYTEVLNEAFKEGNSDYSHKYSDDKTHEKDSTQQELDHECGRLILSLVNMHPGSISALTLNKSDRLKQASERAIGEAFREQLLRKTILGMIDRGIVSGLPKLHESVGITADHRGVNIPDDVTFGFPRTAEEQQRLEDKKRTEHLETEKMLKKSMARTIRNQSINSVARAVKEKWMSSYEKLDRTYNEKITDKIHILINKYFGKKTLRVQKNIESVLKSITKFVYQKVLFTAIYSLLHVLVLWPAKAVLFTMEWKLRKTAGDLLQNVHMEINENLVMKLADTFFEELLAEERRRLEKLAEMRTANPLGPLQELMSSVDSRIVEFNELVKAIDEPAPDITAKEALDVEQPGTGSALYYLDKTIDDLISELHFLTGEKINIDEDNQERFLAIMTAIDRHIQKSKGLIQQAEVQKTPLLNEKLGIIEQKLDQAKDLYSSLA